MRADFILGRVPKNDPYIPKRGEVIQYDRLGDGTWITTHIGDGKNTVQNLPVLADYDLHERVLNLENKVKQLQEKINHG